MTSFIPKGLDLQFLRACKETLTPSDDSAAVAAKDHRPLKRSTMTFNEKRLDMRIWQLNGNHQKGSHFPICVFTNNVSRRSPEKLEERYNRWLLQRTTAAALWKESQAQERPADARWRRRSWSATGQGWGRRWHWTSGYQTYSQASISEPWFRHCGGGWAARDAPTWTAVAADDQTPAGALLEVMFLKAACKIFGYRCMSLR